MYKELKDNQKDVLKALLLAPISVKNGYKYKASLKEHENDLIYKNDNWFCYTNNSSEQSDNGKKIYIVSKQKYCGTKDADMSDIAVAFYESLYEINMLKEDGHLVDDDFAGDTINTPKIVGRSCVNDKPEELNKLIDKYHCLANFWILPQKVGRYKDDNCRPFCKVNYKDYIDIFLKAIMNYKNIRCNNKCDKTKCPSYKKGEFNHCYPKYCTLFNPDKKEEIICWSTFASVHCIDNVYMQKNNGSYEEVPFSNQDNLGIIKSMNKLIDKRADAIIESNLAYPLYLKLTEQLN